LNSKRAANFSYSRSTTTTEAAEVQARLIELSTGILQSSHAHSALLRDLISRQDEQAQVLDEIRSHTGTLRGTESRRSSASSASHGFSYREYSDTASIMSKRSSLSLRWGRSTFIEDLKGSRAYKRLRHFDLGTDSSSDSVLSFDSACTTGNWSMLSNLTLGDLSVSQIAVLNLPIDLANVSNTMSFQVTLSMEAPSSPFKTRCKRSSRGRIHSAIENGNRLVVKALLVMGMDLEELDSSGRTPLVHAAMKHQEAICIQLLEKGASLEAMKAFTSSMDINERSELFEPLINQAMVEGSRTVTVLRLLVLMALGTNYGSGGDDNRYSSQSMVNVAIEMSYGLAVCAVIHLEPQVLTEVDKEGRTPFAYAYYLRRNEICEMLLNYYPTLEAAAKDVGVMELGIRLVEDAHDAIVADRPRILELILAVDARIEKLYAENYGQTLLVVAFFQRRPKVCEMLLNSTRQRMNTAPHEDLKLEGDLTGHFCFAIEENCPRVLNLLLATGVDVGRIVIEDQTLLAYAAEAVLNSVDNSYESWNYICKALLDRSSKANIESLKTIRLRPGTRQCIATSMHELVEKGYRSILVILSLVESRDTEGWTPLASAAFQNNEALCEFMVERGCSLCLNPEQKKQLGPMLSRRIHDAAKGGHETALKLLLDMGADINERNSAGETALLEAVFYKHLPCVRILIKKGADATIKSQGSVSILHRAARKSIDGEMMKFLLGVVETRKLVDRKDSAGYTPLHDCSYNNNQGGAAQLENAMMLLQAGASLTIENSNGDTPYECARCLRREDLAKYLWSQLSPAQQEREKPLPSDW